MIIIITVISRERSTLQIPSQCNFKICPVMPSSPIPSTPHAPPIITQTAKTTNLLINPNSSVIPLFRRLID